ncbi:11275_t:CDS:2, partial [Acaulospora morrowiae]
MTSELKETTFDITKFLDTLDFAAKKHSRQKRKDVEGTPYINHPIGVAKNLTDAGVFDFATIQAAILVNIRQRTLQGYKDSQHTNYLCNIKHDTVEDTDTTFEEIEELFGEEVRNIVEEVTDDKTLPKSERKRLQVVTTPHKSKK